MVRPIDSITAQINSLNAEFDTAVSGRNINFEYLCALIYKISQFKQTMAATDEQERNLKAREKAHATNQALAATHKGLGANHNTIMPIVTTSLQIGLGLRAGSVAAQAAGTFGNAFHGTIKEGDQNVQTKLQHELEHQRTNKDDFKNDAQRAQQAAAESFRSLGEFLRAASDAKQRMMS